LFFLENSPSSFTFAATMAQKKTIRFEAIKNFPNVLQYPENMRGNWHNFFKNHHPITLELACGKGEYTVGLAQLFPNQNFIGVDVKGNRLYVGAKKCLAAGINNAAFLRTHIDKICQYFLQKEVAEIWITFPDPQLRFSKLKKRLTHPKFLRLYQQILVPGGYIHLKTDSPDLYLFTKKVIELYHLELLEDFNDLYALENRTEVLSIKTHYEGLDIAKSNRIHYLKFRLPQEPLEDLDKQLALQLKPHEEAFDPRD
jgi:tRNA (guanine-N7-)-methyltransferase